MDPGGQSGGQSSSKMFVMLGMFFVSRQIKWDEGNTLETVRFTYFAMQILSICVMFYIKGKAAEKNRGSDTVIYVPPKPIPFSTEKRPLEKTTYAEHEEKMALEFLKQIGMGMALASFVHFRFGVNQMLLFQSVMAPLNLLEHALVKKYILGAAEGERVWNEKLEGEVAEDELGPSDGASFKAADDALERALDDAWQNNKASELLGILDSDNVNHQTADNKWSPLMVVCALKGDFTREIGDLLGLGGDVFATDDDGWTCLHWAVFHANETSVRFLSAAERASSYEVDKFLLKADRKGQTPVMVARAEVAKCEKEATRKAMEACIAVLEDAAARAEKGAADGLRQRKAAEDAGEPLQDLD